jgi:hypothetical protein
MIGDRSLLSFIRVIVESIHAEDTLTCIGGKTGNTAANNQSNGREVIDGKYSRVRDILIAQSGEGTPRRGKKYSKSPATDSRLEVSPQVFQTG